jgi:plastocyanin
MEEPMRRRYGSSPLVAGYGVSIHLLVAFGLALSTALADAGPALSPSNAELEEQIIVQMKARSFEPGRVTLHAGQKTKLVLHNQDAELHAFVPVGLFAGVNFNVSGNGAPEFGPEGFKRVIIPSLGQAEFRFVPERPGIYPFFCDMPGHEMKATIVVE